MVAYKFTLVKSLTCSHNVLKKWNIPTDPIRSFIPDSGFFLVICLVPVEVSVGHDDDEALVMLLLDQPQLRHPLHRRREGVVTGHTELGVCGHSFQNLQSLLLVFRGLVGENKWDVVILAGVPNYVVLQPKQT